MAGTGVITAHLDRRFRLWTALLSVGLLLTVAVSIGIGPVQVSPGTTLGVIAHHLGLSLEPTWSEAEESIVWSIRLPRTLLGLAVGAALALSGAALQGIVRNMLADPYILGISGGASTGAAAALLFGVGAGAAQYALPVSAFTGAMAAAALVFALARANGQVTSLRLLLAGVAVGYVLSAATSFLIFASDNAEGSRSVMFWLLGSLTVARWDVFLALVVGAVVVSLLALALCARPLDLLASGDDSARALGINPQALRIRVLVIVSLCTGAAVAAAGAIGFVGLVVPHMARRLVGASYSRLLPVCALLGPLLLIWADVLARTLMQPRELPIGIITALVGAPLLLVLIRRMHAR